MVVLKTAKEIAQMQKACVLSAQALKLGGELCVAGTTTAAIDKKIRQFIQSNGAVPSFLGYGGFPASACISVNDEIIHGIPSGRTLKDGDVVSIDVGAYIDGYHGDNAATFAVGEISEDAKSLLKETQAALYKAIDECRPGKRLGDLGNAIESHVKQFGFGIVREYVGHGVGKDLHESPEIPNYGRPGHGLRLMPGMTIAIEPMINLKGDGIKAMGDGWTVKTASGSYAAHFEHTIYITESDPVILTRP